MTMRSEYPSEVQLLLEAIS